MERKTFRDLYKAERNKPTAAQQFIERIARLTHRTETTVRMWVVGNQVPDELVQNVIASELGADPRTLFPKSKTN